MRSPLAGYYGSKARLAPRIVALLPRHDHYVEPFAGSLAVLLAKPRSTMETVNDLDGELMAFWRVLRDRPDELARVCELTPHSRAEYLAAYDRGGCDDLERARRVWTVLAQSRSGRLAEDARGWRYAIDGKPGHGNKARRLLSMAQRIPATAERLGGVSLECRPALEVVETYGASPTALLYVDPPYLGTTRDGRNWYALDMASESEHSALLSALRACRASVVLSGYESSLYASLLGDWHTVRLSAQTQARNARVETLWSNRPFNTQGALCGLPVGELPHDALGLDGGVPEPIAGGVECPRVEMPITKDVRGVSQADDGLVA